MEDESAEPLEEEAAEEEDEAAEEDEDEEKEWVPSLSLSESLPKRSFPVKSIFLWSLMLLLCDVRVVSSTTNPLFVFSFTLLHCCVCTSKFSIYISCLFFLSPLLGFVLSPFY